MSYDPRRRLRAARAGPVWEVPIMTQHQDPQGDMEPAVVPAEGPMFPGTTAEASAARSDAAIPEKDIWQGHSSWKNYSDLLLVALGWTVVAVIIGFTTPPAVVWMAIGLTILAWVYVLGRMAYGVLSCRYRLTTQRLFIERGILSRTIDQTELIRVDDVRIHKRLLDRLMGLGSVQIMSTDASDKQIRIVGVENPDQLADSIREHTRALRRKSVFVESL